MGSIFCCKFFKGKPNEETIKTELPDIKKDINDEIKRKIEFNDLSSNKSKEEEKTENIFLSKKNESSISQKINEDDDVIQENLKLTEDNFQKKKEKKEKKENLEVEEKKENKEEMNLEKKENKEEMNLEKKENLEEMNLEKKENKEDYNLENLNNENENKSKTVNTLMSMSIESKVKDILKKIDENDNKEKISEPIKIETQFKKVNTKYSEEEKKERDERLKKRLEKAKKKRQIEKENQEKIHLDENIIKKAEEVEKKFTKDSNQ